MRVCCFRSLWWKTIVTNGHGWWRTWTRLWQLARRCFSYPAAQAAMNSLQTSSSILGLLLARRSRPFMATKHKKHAMTSSGRCACWGHFVSQIDMRFSMSMFSSFGIMFVLFPVRNGCVPSVPIPCETAPIDMINHHWDRIPWRGRVITLHTGSHIVVL